MRDEEERTIAHALLVIALLLGLFAAFDARSEGLPEQELKALEQSRTEAIRTGDMETLDRLYADDFHGVTTAGQVVDKAALLPVFKGVDRRLTFANGDMQVRVIGKVALVSGLVKGRAGDEVVTEFRYLHVYEKREGRWQLTAGQSTPVARS
ncbi:MAG: nuclear transport factor 2 family protein [Thermoanaerobaculia bacterium]